MTEVKAWKALEGVGGGLGVEGGEGQSEGPPPQPAQTWESGSRCPSFERTFLVTLSPLASHHFPHLPRLCSHGPLTWKSNQGNSCSWTTCMLHLAFGLLPDPHEMVGHDHYSFADGDTKAQGREVAHPRSPASEWPGARTAIQTFSIGPIPQMLVKNYVTSRPSGWDFMLPRQGPLVQSWSGN